MKRLIPAVLMTLFLVSTVAQAEPEGRCEVDVRVNDILGDWQMLEMNRSEDQHWFAGTIEGVRLGLAVVEKGEGKLQIDATDAKSGAELVKPQSIAFKDGLARAQVIGGNVILDITCN